MSWLHFWKMRKIKEYIKKVLSLCGVDHYAIMRWKGKDIAYNVNHTHYGKRTLMLYIVNPFFDKKLSESHQNHWQAIEMARIIGKQGFDVDVIDYKDSKIKLKYMYDMVVGLIPRGIDVYSKNLKRDAIRISYLTSMNFEFGYNAEKQRIEGVRNRRGTELQMRRFAGFEKYLPGKYIDKEIEQFDAVWYIGNAYNFHSYDKFNMPTSYFIKNNGYSFSDVENSYLRNSKNFLFFASSGQVHKGLDLLLEIFSENDMRDYRLYVCSNYEKEEDFCKEYYRELFATNNIIPCGFVDIESVKFKSIIKKCAYTILPSCSEGCAGSVLTAMSGGVIPIVSKECGFENDEVINLPDCNKETICQYIRIYSQKDKRWIEENAKKSMEVVKTRYSKADFSTSVRNAITDVLLRKSMI